MPTILDKPKTMRVAALGGLVLNLACVIADSGPGPADRQITCDNYDRFQQICTANCSPTWDCELNYLDLDLGSQIALDVCSDCLADNLSAGLCLDCAVPEEGVRSCQGFMEALLGVDCW